MSTNYFQQRPMSPKHLVISNSEKSVCYNGGSMKKKHLPKGFEVEWCKHVPCFPDGSADIDQAEYVVEEFANKAEATKRAAEVLPLDAFGSVRITEFEMIAPDPSFPWYKLKEFTGDPEHYE